MKILVISDVVENRIYSEHLKSSFPDIDLVLSAGDLPCSYLEYIVSVLNKPLVYVNGNHDTDASPSGRRIDCPGGINAHARVVKVQGLAIAGLEGSMRYNRGGCQYTESGMRTQIWKLVPGLLKNRLKSGKFCDILLTHAAPKGIGDAPDLAHKGFKAFLDFMDDFKPRLLVHGHIHLYDRNAPSTNMYKDTTIVNAYGYKIIEIDEASPKITISNI